VRNNGFDCVTSSQPFLQAIFVFHNKRCIDIIVIFVVWS